MAVAGLHETGWVAMLDPEKVDLADLALALEDHSDEHMGGSIPGVVASSRGSCARSGGSPTATAPAS